MSVAAAPTGEDRCQHLAVLVHIPWRAPVAVKGAQGSG